ncbi:MAG: winged helix-turn-helix domain-containing protein [Acidobacteria bacterium]|nr:winged helix-turn-helix domain-containing protein [Acidobacteriota bacterium]
MSSTSTALTLSQARRIALHAQGLAKGRPTTPITSGLVGRTFKQLQLVQIDSVNVLSRSHYLPFFARLGNYDRSLVDTHSSYAPRKMMEYWAHEASFIQPEHFADLKLWQNRVWVGASKVPSELRADLEQQILALLGRSRPMTARAITARIAHVEERDASNWGWNWNSVKRVLEDLFEQGVVAAAGRTDTFERRYALVEKVLPAGLIEAEDPDPLEAMVRLIDAAARAHGVGTVRCFADYFRLPIKASAAAVATLVQRGQLESVEVTGWPGEQFRHVQAALPRRARGRALLSPFDSLVFERRRLEQLFGFHYRLEIYTPAPKRQFGYYVLPFLLGESIVARVDLKADRGSKVLLARAVHSEPGAPANTAQELAEELMLMA